MNDSRLASKVPDLFGWATRLAVLALTSLLAPNAVAGTVDVVEFYHAGFDHYFMTSLQADIDAIDTGKMPGWTRTGKTFAAYAKKRTGTSPVCRFYIPHEAGDSHFYSASAAECAQTRNKFPSFIEESEAVMYVHLPHPKTGACTGQDKPVYRVWNHRKDSNHRYTTDRAVRAEMVAEGWTAEGYGPDQVIMCALPKDASADPVGDPLPPPCKGTNPLVALPGAPHGMYVWNPGAKLLPYLVSDVIGIDPSLCGASLVIPWSSVETSKGVYDWSAVMAAAEPFVKPGVNLTVNLLFSEATEGPVNTVTPAWVTAPVSSGGDGVPTVSCAGKPTMPVYFNSQYEADWKAFIAAMIHHFSFSNSTLAANVGYMRFATAGGAEALPPPGYNDGGACEKAWEMAGYTYDVWNTHEANIINAMGTQPTDKQIMVSLPNVSGGPAGTTVYTVSNMGAAAAVALNVGLSFENLGTTNVAEPGPCDPTATIIDLHWCQAYQKYVGQVPLAMQPITATTKPSPTDPTMPSIDITDLLKYALDNKIQIFELYPEEWLQADSPSSPGFVLSRQATYKAALQSTMQVLGATNGQ